MRLRLLLIQHPDGSYEPKRQITINTPSVKVTLNPGTRFRRGVKISGVDITEMLDIEVD